MTDPFEVIRDLEPFGHHHNNGGPICFCGVVDTALSQAQQERDEALDDLRASDAKVQDLYAELERHAENREYGPLAARDARRYHKWFLELRDQKMPARNALQPDKDTETE